MHSQTAENVNFPAASSRLFNGIADRLAVIIGSLSVAFAFGMSLRVYVLQESFAPLAMPLPAGFIAQGLCFCRSKNIIFSRPIGAGTFGISLKSFMVFRRNNRLFCAPYHT
ncbi:MULTISPECIES: hypothetical protein [unclassified Serratia (in: enterobacteria)]|uniref:hypothetical protein n=1 Tax=unclassified Serratia (in: enterobacteria) TaxID=2647522 RepID=UPI002ED4443F|nr:hypothetical protein [Serratia sp. C2(2)]MEE4445119.1 hypothetical protein [Serratia sp. C2(1)]